MSKDSHPVCQVVGLVKPEMQPKRVAARGQGGSCPTTCPCACKVMQVINPSPEAMITSPPAGGPIQMAALSLFEEPALLGGNEVGPSGPVSSGMYNHQSPR